MVASTVRRLLAFSLGLLLALGVALSRPTPAEAPAIAFAPVVVSQPADLPMIPDSVRSTHGWVRVHFVQGVFLCGRVEAWGCYTYRSRFMQVDTALSPSMRWRVLEHERVHMILGDAHLTSFERSNDEPGEVDDAIADAIADVRLLDFGVLPLAK